LKSCLEVPACRINCPFPCGAELYSSLGKTGVLRWAHWKSLISTVDVRQLGFYSKWPKKPLLPILPGWPISPSRTTSPLYFPIWMTSNKLNKANGPKSLESQNTLAVPPITLVLYFLTNQEALTPKAVLLTRLLVCVKKGVKTPTRCHNSILP